MNSDFVSIRSKFLNGSKLLELSKEYGYSRAAIRNWLKADGCYKYRANFKPFEKKYQCDERYFDQINTSEKAYWLGFIAADGSVEERRRLTVQLAEKDKGHIQLLKTALESSHPLRKVIQKNTPKKGSTLKKKTYIRYSLDIWSPIMCESLKTYGIIQNKSLVLEFCESIPSKFVHDYIRGYFDGDGSFVLSQGQLRFSVVSSPMFLKVLQEILMREAVLSKTKWKKEGKSFSFRYSGNKQNKRIFDYLYTKECVCLKRKREKAEKILYPT